MNHIQYYIFQYKLHVRVICLTYVRKITERLTCQNVHNVHHWEPIYQEPEAAPNVLPLEDTVMTCQSVFTLTHNLDQRADSFSLQPTRYEAISGQRRSAPLSRACLLPANGYKNA